MKDIKTFPGKEPKYIINFRNDSRSDEKTPNVIKRMYDTFSVYNLIFREKNLYIQMEISAGKEQRAKLRNSNCDQVSGQ